MVNNKYTNNGNKKTKSKTKNKTKENSFQNLELFSNSALNIEI